MLQLTQRIQGDRCSEKEPKLYSRSCLCRTGENGHRDPSCAEGKKEAFLFLYDDYSVVVSLLFERRALKQNI